MRRVLTYALVYGIAGATVGALVAIYTRGDNTHEVNPGVFLTPPSQTPRAPAEAVTPARDVSRNGRAASKKAAEAETIAEVEEVTKVEEVSE